MPRRPAVATPGAAAVVEAGLVFEGPAPADGAFVEEAQLLAVALRKLRQERAPAAALDVLDQYRARFPSGALAAEAMVARIDALLVMGRRNAVLELLGSLSLSGYSRRRELLVLRGELQTEAGDCAGALLDLDAVARVPVGDLVEERAIYGKALCLARLNERREAGTTLHTYLRRFPHGRFVRSALQALLEEGP